MKQQESPQVEERNKRSLAFQVFATGDWKYFSFFSSYILFSLFSSLYSWDLKLFFTLSQKLFPSIVRLHKWEIRSEDSSKLRFQIATFLRFSCQNLQFAKGLEEVNSMTVCTITNHKHFSQFSIVMALWNLVTFKFQVSLLLGPSLCFEYNFCLSFRFWKLYWVWYNSNI